MAKAKRRVYKKKRTTRKRMSGVPGSNYVKGCIIWFNKRTKTRMRSCYNAKGQLRIKGEA